MDNVDCVRIVEAIEYLRSDEGDSVLLMNDNPEFGGPAAAIECNGDWTEWLSRRIEGDSMLDCLLKAVAEKRKWQK